MDIIFLEAFRIRTLIGIYPWERKIPQTIELNLEIGLPSKHGCLTDRIEDTLDYAQIVERIRAMLMAQHFSLLETLAEHIAQMILTEFRSPWVKVSVAKLDVLEGVGKLGITIERGERG